MLILTRRKGENILINGADIRITVVDIGAGQVKIGIDAPKDVSVHREEIYEKIQAGMPNSSVNQYKKTEKK